MFMQNKKEVKRSSSHSSFFPKNQRGQGLSTNAIILIILGVVILVVLIIGFTMGWSNIAPWLSGDNVNTIANQCEASCSTQSSYDYCTKQRELKASDLPVDTNGKRQKSVTMSCFEFSVLPGYGDYGIKDCPGLSCSPVYIWVESGIPGCSAIGGIPENNENCDVATKLNESVCCEFS
jgi:hypothetical protein